MYRTSLKIESHTTYPSGETALFDSFDCSEVESVRRYIFPNRSLIVGGIIFFPLLVLIIV